MEFDIKLWKNFHYKKRKLVIREKDFQIIKIHHENKKKKKKEDEIKTYSLSDSLITDQTKNNDLEILIASKDYKLTIKPSKLEDKSKIIKSIKNIIKKYTFQNVYKDYNEKISHFNDKENEISPQDFLIAKLFLFKNLMNEMNQKIVEFNPYIKAKPKSKTENEMTRIYTNINAIKEEMENQFQVILTYLNQYFDINENIQRGSLKRINTLLSNLSQKEKNESNEIEKDNLVSSDDEQINKNLNIGKLEEENQNIAQNSIIEKDKENIKNDNSPYGFLSHDNKDFQNDLYNFPKRNNYNIILKYPHNIVKEMISSMTQNKPAPVYFNEPLSMGQRQCEKFFYSSLLKKVSEESNNKSLQLGYICAFIIGEIFLSINRNLKPFNSIIGETYEYYDNENKFRYYSEQVSHHPQITAFIGESPEFALYGDTKNSTSFKILKGAMELSFKNKVHLHIKSTNDHFVYNRPNIMVKGFLKPPLHNDYNGTTIIENENFPENKLELKFIEESWTNPELGLIEGKIFCNEKIVYLIKGNWTNIIYLIDNDNKDNKIELLKIDKSQKYLQNGANDDYYLPSFCYNLNFMDKRLEETLPKNDSRFRKDIRFLEEKVDTKEAQAYKEKYEEKQRKELNDENHKVLFFEERYDRDGENYFIPNGKYWELKKKNLLKNNINSDIFDVSKY